MKPSKPYEEVQITPALIWRWVREGDEYVMRISEMALEAHKAHIEAALAQPEQDYIKKLEDDYRKQLDELSQRNYELRHAVAQPEQSKYSDIVSGGGFDPRNKFDAQPEQKLDYPPECTTPEMELAYAAGWWKALEVQRNKQHPLDKKATNARELGLDYEVDHGFDRTASHMAGEYVDTAGTEHQFKYMFYGLRADENGMFSIGEISQREWVSLTSEELASIVVEHAGFPTRQLTAIEAKLREKNE